MQKGETHKASFDLALNTGKAAEGSSDNACAPFLGQRFEKVATEDGRVNSSREKKDRRKTTSLLNFRSCSSQKVIPEALEA